VGIGTDRVQEEGHDQVRLVGQVRQGKRKDAKGLVKETVSGIGISGGF